MKKLLLLTALLSITCFALEDTDAVLMPQTDFDVTSASISTDGMKKSKTVQRAEREASEVQKQRIQLDRDMVQHQRALNTMTNQQNQMLNAMF